MRVVLLVLFVFIVFGCKGEKKSLKYSREIAQNWTFKQADTDEWLPASIPGTVHTDLLINKKIEDPYYRDNEKKLQWIDKKDWEYSTTFNVTADILNKDKVQLDFKGLDTYADIYLNDKQIASTNNMFREWQIDCKEYLKAGENRLQVYLHSPINTDLPKLEALGYALPASNDQSENGGLGNKRVSPFARKAPYHYGWDWGPRFVTSGVWRPVYLQAWDKARIVDVYFRQDKLNLEKAELTAQVELDILNAGKYTIKISDQKNSIDVLHQLDEMEPGNQTVEIPILINNPRLWWPNGMGEAYLYNFDVRLIDNNSILDTREISIGIRTLELVREADKNGKSFYFKINNKPVFSKGANYIPNDVFLPRVSPGKYEYVIKSAADANMNMLRVWGGGIYENDIFYDLCDKYGIMVWQDFMFACSMYPGDDAFLENVRQEAIQNVQRLRNHPSIALWCGNNEIDVAWAHDLPVGWGWKEQYDEKTRAYIWNSYDTLFHKILPAVIDENDPARTYWPSSPLAEWGERASYSSTSGDMHYWGVWHGKERFDQFKVKKARFMSEFGFQSFPELETVKKYTAAEDRESITTDVMNAHQRSGIGNERIREYLSWYYKMPSSFEDMLYMSQVLQAEGMKIGFESHRQAKPYCMGTLYWQINDCWPVASWSGMDYYGRWKALHYFAKKAFENILVAATVDNDSLKVYIVSDEYTPVNAKLSLVLMDFDGTEFNNQQIDVEIPVNSSKVHFSEIVKDFLKGNSKENVVLSLSLIHDDKKLTENVFYFDEVKDLDLPKVSPKLSVSSDDNGYRVEISSEQLAKNVYLSIPGSIGQFSDNYFDLLPGETKVVYFSGYAANRTFSAEDIKFKTVRDTY